jgi:hypothetical protein
MQAFAKQSWKSAVWHPVRTLPPVVIEPVLLELNQHRLVGRYIPNPWQQGARIQEKNLLGRKNRLGLLNFREPIPNLAPENSKIGRDEVRPLEEVPSKHNFIDWRFSESDLIGHECPHAGYCSKNFRGS